MSLKQVTPNRVTLKRAIVPLLLIVGASLSLLGCGDAGEEVAGITTTSSTTTSTTIDESNPGSAAEVKVSSSNLGDLLTTADGRTLYLYTPDGNGDPTCEAECAQTWPPLTTQNPPRSSDLKPGLIATTERGDGTLQVTAAGHPLYTYSGDSQSGDTSGQGYGGVWFAVSPKGQPIKASRSSDQQPLPGT